MSDEQLIAQPWAEINPAIVSPVRNTGQEYLRFINTSEFSRAAQHFMRHGCYTLAPPDTLDYNAFWDEEERRCREGFSVGGVRITGQHYAYLNYGRILLVTGDGKKQRKRIGFPQFLDMDYYYYHELEEAEKNGQGMIVVKARRKGFSYKNAFNMVWKYKWFPEAICILAAFEKTFWENTMQMCLSMIDFLDEHTDWNRRRLVDKQDHIKQGYKEVKDGIEIEKGYLSEILALSFKDSPQKSVGRTAEYMLFEEAGDWPGLRQAYQRSYPLFRDGNVMVGIPILYGTGGNNRNGTNEDFEYMFYNPSQFGLRAYENIYDEHAVGECGWFVDEMWFRKPFVDKAGNALREEASLDLEKERDLKKNGSSLDYAMFVTQHPRTPKEAFLKPGGAVFPQTEIYRAINRLKANNAATKLTRMSVGELFWTSDEDKPVGFKPDLSKTLPVLDQFPPPPNASTEGAIVIFEHPPEHKPFGLYKIGYDPYRFDKSGSKSLGSAIVYKGYGSMDESYDQIVAEYTGRPESIEVFHNNLEMLAEYYNARIMHENEVPEVVSYFKRRGKLNLLAMQPDNVINKAILKPTVNRVYGCHMNDKLKDTGEKYIIRWLLTKRGTDPKTGDVIFNVDLIPSLPLLQELQNYRRDEGNFDRVMALMQLMFVIEDEYEQRTQETYDGHPIAESLLSKAKNFFARSSSRASTKYPF